MTIRLWDETRARNIADGETRRLLQLLRGHVGRDQAICMASLYEQWSGETLPRDAAGKPDADVPTLSRHMRKLIDDLRDVYGVPVMSSARHGYWIVASEAELDEVVHEFRTRGLKSLTTAARLKKISLADELTQLKMELVDPAGGEP
jgi:hypothetical protein